MSFEGAPFIKMHGLGNDFVVFDLRGGDPAFGAAVRRPEIATRLADRRRGVGCDQLILIEDDAQAEARLVFLNADGSESGACGNGTRCAGDLVLGARPGPIDFVTGGGLLRVERRADGRIRVDMGRPRFGFDEAPLAPGADSSDLRAAFQSAPLDLRTVGPREMCAVSMGNPHCVMIFNALETVDVEGLGAYLERHPVFPERANIGFVEVLAPDRLRVRVFERGVGVTQACGSGACAAFAVTLRRQLCEAKATLELDGGALDLEYDAESGSILMTGPATRVFDGRLNGGLMEGLDG